MPYNYTRNPHGFFEFTTDRGYDYVASFLSYPDLFKDFPAIADKVKIFDFAVTNARNQRLQPDPKVKQTIVAILHEYLTRHNDAVIFVCDSGDGKQIGRHKRFEAWFTEAATDEYDKYNAVFTNEGSVYTSMLISKQHELKSVFNEAFKSIVEDIHNLKAE